MQETQEIQVQSLGREDPLEKEMATHSSILAFRTLWTEEPGGLQSLGSYRVRHGQAYSHSMDSVCAVYLHGPSSLFLASQFSTIV